MKDRVFQLIKKKNESKWLKKLGGKNTNKNPTIICNNCIGGVIYHNLGLKFLSPTINLFFPCEDYLFFCKNLKYYSQCDVVKVTDASKEYPVGKIIPTDNDHKEIILNFQHYSTFEEAREKWIERFKRINWNNVFFIFEFYDTLYSKNCLYGFDEADLPGKKIILCHRELPDLNNYFVLSCYRNDKPVAKVLQYDGISGKRYLDEWDYVKFLND